MNYCTMIEKNLLLMNNNNSEEVDYIPIVDIQFLDTEIPAEKAVNAFIIKNLEDLNSEEKEEFFKEFNNNDNDLIDDTNKRKKDMKNNDKGKKLRRDYFETKTPRLDSLMNVIRKNYLDESKNKKTLLELNNNGNIQFIAVTKTNELINIEIQLQNTDNIFKRTLYYASDAITHSLKRGSMYNTLPKVIMINILHYNVFSDEKRFKRYYSLKDNILNEEEGFNGILNFHFVELLKYEKLQKEGKLDEKNLWLLFLIDPNNDYFLKEGTPEKFTQARKVLISLEEKNSIYNNECDKEMKAYNDYLNGLEYQKKKGKKINKIETVLTMLKNNFDIEAIKVVSKFDSRDILEIKKLLNKPDDITIRQLAEKLEIDSDSLTEIYKEMNN